MPLTLEGLKESREWFHDPVNDTLYGFDVFSSIDLPRYYLIVRNSYQNRRTYIFGTLFETI